MSNSKPSTPAASPSLSLTKCKVTRAPLSRALVGLWHALIPRRKATFTTSLYASPEAAAYPNLDQLLGGYFHQDFDLNGHTLAEILAVYREDTNETHRQQTVSDIHRFLNACGNSDASLAEAFQRVFRPDVIIEGWEGLTGRQWLEEVARLLSQGPIDMGAGIGNAAQNERAQRAADARPIRLAASSWTSVRIAEDVISEAIRVNKLAIDSWAQRTDEVYLRLQYVGIFPIGHGVLRATGLAQPMSNARAILKRTQKPGRTYFVLTSYPEPSLTPSNQGPAMSHSALTKPGSLQALWAKTRNAVRRAQFFNLTRALGLWHPTKGSTTSLYATPEASAYPELDQLLGCYFHQDFEIVGRTAGKILAAYRQDVSEAVRQETVSDIHRFLADHSHSDATLADALRRVFRPEVLIEGWEGLTSREWLEEIVRLLA